MASIFHGLSQTIGLKGLGIIGNGLGPAAYHCLIKHFIPGKAFKGLKKLILKDPTPMRVATTQLRNMFTVMQDVQCELRVLSLSRLGFDTRAML